MHIPIERMNTRKHSAHEYVWVNKFIKRKSSKRRRQYLSRQQRREEEELVQFTYTERSIMARYQTIDTEA